MWSALGAWSTAQESPGWVGCSPRWTSLPIALDAAVLGKEAVLPGLGTGWKHTAE